MCVCVCVCVCVCTYSKQCSTDVLHVSVLCPSCAGRASFAGVDLMDVLFGEDQKGADCQGHGSRVASIAVGQTLGVAVGAHVKSLRVSGAGCRTGTVLSALIQGIDFVIQQKRAYPDRPVSAVGTSNNVTL